MFYIISHTFRFILFISCMSCPKIASFIVQEANPHRELRYFNYLQFCAERRAGRQIHKASMATIKIYHLHISANKSIGYKLLGSFIN